MKDNGLVDVKTKTIRAPFVLASASDALHLLQEGAGAYRAVVASLGEAESAKAWSNVYECLKGFAAAGRVETELEVIIGSGAEKT
jgi:hypothetical protein